MIADGKNTLMSVGINSDVVKVELECYNRWKEQPINLVKDLTGTIDQKCEAIFSYLVERTTYRIDPVGSQYIKSPARLLKDGFGDCKSLTMFLVCCLHCAGIPHIIRFVNFDNSTQYSHVYAVALDENKNEIILDACEKDDNGIILYNFARPYKHKLDFYYDR